MASTMRAVKVPPNSLSLEEARKRTFDFFRSACRSIPTVMETYNLHDVATVSQLRSSIASQIRQNASITNPKLCNLLKELACVRTNVKHGHQRRNAYI
ncbi:hypothetical protein MKW94_027845 [Papaver nudicaule]|uniref:NADH dehydrogenase [ubiquinone] 1 alpha subcomplex subunit 6 n=1 Tax=Papaver nudicaule TaxID=74823 RepID=A0AA41RTA1_PAPNU|nr:hypothetical protein [Papaver nudicaule]